MSPQFERRAIHILSVGQDRAAVARFHVATDQRGHQYLTSALGQTTGILRCRCHTLAEPCNHFRRVIGVGDCHHAGNGRVVRDQQQALAMHAPNRRPAYRIDRIPGPAPDQGRPLRCAHQCHGIKRHALVTNTEDVCQTFAIGLNRTAVGLRGRVVTIPVLLSLFDGVLQFAQQKGICPGHHPLGHITGPDKRPGPGKRLNRLAGTPISCSRQCKQNQQTCLCCVHGQ